MKMLENASHGHAIKRYSRVYLQASIGESNETYVVTVVNTHSS